MFQSRIIWLSVSLLLLGGCATTPKATAPVTYTHAIKPLMEAKCLGCHGSGSPDIAEFDKDKAGYKAKGIGPRMDSYEHLVGFVNGDDAGAIMRRLDDGKHTADGKPGNMYENLGATAAERQHNLALFKAWVGAWNLKKPDQLNAAERALATVPR
ncbi:MAG: hypothetical protein ACFCUG_06765 [Thiotrichales bacterium]